MQNTRRYIFVISIQAVDIRWNTTCCVDKHNSHNLTVQKRNYHLHTWYMYKYSQIVNIRRTNSQNLNASRLGLQLSLPNLLKPCIKLRMEMFLEHRWYIWVSNNLITHKGATYIRDFMVHVNIITIQTIFLSQVMAYCDVKWWVCVGSWCPGCNLQSAPLFWNGIWIFIS